MRILNFFRFNFAHFLIPGLLLSANFSCDKDDDNHDSGYAGPTGTVQGVVTDGVTGHPIDLNLSTEEGKPHLFALVHNRMLPAYAISQPTAEQEGLQGEFHLPNVPLDETFPVFARVPGYDNFQGYVTVSSVHAQDVFGTDGDVDRGLPTLVANIKLYPIGSQAKDLKLAVFNNGQAVAGAQVHLRPLTEANKLATKNTSAVAVEQKMNSFQGPDFYLYPSSSRLQSLSGVTDKNGNIVFSGSQLVLGGQYEYVVIPSGGAAQQSFRSDVVTIGPNMNGASLTSVPYDILVNLEDATPALRLESSSLRANKPNELGEVILVFNRPVELALNSEDGVRASLSSTDKFQLNEDVRGNGVSETVQMTFEGNVLILRPNFKGGIMPKSDVAPNLSIQYSGIYIRPVDGPASNSSVNLENLVGRSISVSFFGG